MIVDLPVIDYCIMGNDGGTRKWLSCMQWLLLREVMAVHVVIAIMSSNYLGWH